jgi:hypothetical protein
LRTLGLHGDQRLANGKDLLQLWNGWLGEK